MFTKQNLRFLFALLCSVFLVSCVIEELEFGSISPETGKPESTYNCTVTGINTTFQDEAPVTDILFSPDTGLTVFNKSIVSNTEIRFDLQIAVDAPLGLRSVIIVYDNGKKTVVGYNVFRVASLTTPPTQEITLENVTCLPGSQSVDVMLDNPVPVRGVQFDIFDEYSYLTIEEMHTMSRTEGFYATVNKKIGRVLLVSLSGESIKPGTGSILAIEFTVSENAPEGECIDLYLENVKIVE